MTGVPPAELGKLQTNPICTSVVTAGASLKFRGSVGTVSITAVPPSSENGELPTTLVADIIALTVDPHGRR